MGQRLLQCCPVPPAQRGYGSADPLPAIATQDRLVGRASKSGDVKLQLAVAGALQRHSFDHHTRSKTTSRILQVMMGSFRPPWYCLGSPCCSLLAAAACSAAGREALPAP